MWIKLLEIAQMGLPVMLAVILTALLLAAGRYGCLPKRFATACALLGAVTGLCAFLLFLGWAFRTLTIILGEPEFFSLD